MDRLDAYALFVRIVDAGSFSAAATHLEMPRATATHAIQQLEQRLGVRLLARTTRRVRPTVDGEAFYERCVQILGDVEDAETALRNVAASPHGMLRVEMHGAHATRIVLPRIDAFRRTYPGIDLVCTSGDRIVDLVGEGIDCAIRSGQLRHSGLVAHPLAAMPQLICASPDYLDRNGTPRDPKALSGHSVVKFVYSNGSIDRALDLYVDGEIRNVVLDGWMAVNDAEAYVVSAVRGCGLIQLPRFHVEHELQTGQLVEVLPTWPSPDMPVAALYPVRRHLTPRVRVFIDWLDEVYRELFAVPQRH